MSQSVGAVAYQTIEQLAKRLARRELSSRELVQQCLARIDALNPSLNAFVMVAAEQALEQAERADRERANGRATGPLHGIPYAVKDVIATKGIPTTNGSRVVRGRDDVDAEVVSRLNRSGAVLLGKLNLWEYAMVGSQFGVVRNPWNTEYSASGSSGGSAAAVAAGLVPLALGTDTGGSIRVPAAHCGVVGLRPTYGRISRDGVTPNAWSVDTVGPITRTAADAAIAFRALAADDRVAAGNRPATNARRTSPARWRLGLVRWFFENTHPDVERAVTDALRQLERGGSRLVDVDVPHATDAALARTLHLAEAAAFHERPPARSSKRDRTGTAIQAARSADVSSRCLHQGPATTNAARGGDPARVRDLRSPGDADRSGTAGDGVWGSRTGRGLGRPEYFPGEHDWGARARDPLRLFRIAVGPADLADAAGTSAP